MESSKAIASTAISTTTSSTKSKILPVVLLSAIPLNLWNGKEKVNIKNRTQPYERTSCTNCNRQTSNQQSTSTRTTQASTETSYSSAIKVSSMFQSPMLILPILPTTNAAVQAKSLPNIFSNQQPFSTIYHAKKMVADETSRVRTNEQEEIFFSYFLMRRSILCLNTNNVLYIREKCIVVEEMRKSSSF